MLFHLGNHSNSACCKRGLDGFLFCILILIILSIITSKVPRVFHVQLNNLVLEILTIVQVIINCGVLPCLVNLLSHNHKKSIKKEACWTISNITAGTKEQISAVISESEPRCFFKSVLQCTQLKTG